jgi:hypothetical protein
MLKKSIVIIILCIFALAGCKSGPSKTDRDVSASESLDNTFWNTGYAYGELIFHGAAGIYSKREESIRLALEDAAKKVAIFNMVEARYLSSTSIGASFFDYSFNTETSLKYDENYKNYVETLIFDPDQDVIQSNNTIFVRVRYRSSMPVQIQYMPSSFPKNAKPPWVDNSPHIPGYMVGVGYAGRRAALRDTITASYENAIFSIITTMCSSIKEESTNVQGSGTLTFSTTNTHEISATGVLTNFYILDTWIDSANKAVWTLALAKEHP